MSDESPASTSNNEPSLDDSTAEVVSIHKAKESASIHPIRGRANDQASSWNVDDILDSGTYDPARFYTEASYGGGQITHSHAIPSQLSYEIDAIVQSGRFPWYRTRSDFHRDADYHRIKWLNDNLQVRPETESIMNTIALEQALLEERNHLTAMKRVLVEADAAVADAVGEGDIASLERLVDKSEHYAASLEHPYYDRYMDIMHDAEKALVELKHQRRRQQHKDAPVVDPGPLHT